MSRKGHGLFVYAGDVTGLFAGCGGIAARLLSGPVQKRAYMDATPADFLFVLADVDPALSISAAALADFAHPIPIFAPAISIFSTAPAIFLAVSALSVLKSA